MPTTQLNPERQAELDRHFAEQHRRACPLPGLVPDESGRRPLTLGERIMQEVPDGQTFTGQVHYEVHCKDGLIKDEFLVTRRKRH